MMIILDNNANLVYYKCVKSVDVFRLERNSKMFYTTYSFDCIIDSTFHGVDSIKSKNETSNDPHECLVLQNGHLLLMTTEKMKVDLTNSPTLKKEWKSDTADVSSTVIQEQDELHNVLFEWHAKDHFGLNDSDSFFDYHSSRPDWMHCNAISMDEDGNILLSIRNLSQIIKINRTDGSIMWRFGGQNNEFKFVNCPVPFYGQHDIKKIDNGHLMLFDNGVYTVSHGARAMEFDLDEKNKIATLIWSYTYNPDMSSLAQGGVQRLSNGNTLISIGKHSGENVCFVIVNTKGEKVYQVNGPHSYRVMNYTSLPFQLHRPVISCFDSAGLKYLDAGEGYKSYKWSTGDTTRIINLTKSGSYSVFVPYGDGGFISSENITVSNLLKPCDLKILSGRKKNRK